MTASPGRRRGAVPLVAAVLLVVVGLVLVATGPPTAVLDFGHVAGREPWWQPVVLAAEQQVGAGLVVLGLVLGALAAGLRLGARRR